MKELAWLKLKPDGKIGVIQVLFSQKKIFTNFSPTYKFQKMIYMYIYIYIYTYIWYIYIYIFIYQFASSWEWWKILYRKNISNNQGLIKVTYPSLHIKNGKKRKKGKQMTKKVKISSQLNTSRGLHSTTTQLWHNCLIIALKIPLNHTIC